VARHSTPPHFATVFPEKGALCADNLGFQIGRKSPPPTFTLISRAMFQKLRALILDEDIAASKAVNGDASTSENFPSKPIKIALLKAVFPNLPENRMVSENPCIVPGKMLQHLPGSPDPAILNLKLVVHHRFI
jgi:hypothetical protein